MDKERKKQLLEEYRNRRPEMGVISLRCIATGDVFLGISRDTKAEFNSICCKLETSWHPNKRLQELWNQYGQTGFELSIPKILKYEDANADYTEELEELREQCLDADNRAQKIWK